MLAYLQTLLSYSDESREITKINEGWHKDTPFAFDSFEVDANGNLLNQGAQDRLLRFAVPTPVKERRDPEGHLISAARLDVDWESTNGTGFFIGTLLSDFSTLDFGIIPGAPVKIEFTTNSPEFYLMAHPSAVVPGKQAPVVEIVSIQLKIMNRVLPPDNYNAIVGPISNGKKTQQSFLQLKISSQDVRMGGLSWSQDNFLGGDMIGERSQGFLNL